jgi:arylsulfatase
VPYPNSYKGSAILPAEGRSLVPILQGKEREIRPLFWEHEGNRAMRLGKWKLVARYPEDWELYDTETDRTELTNLAKAYPEEAKKMSALYEEWAKRCGVLPPNMLPPQRTMNPSKGSVNATEREESD